MDTSSISTFRAGGNGKFLPHPKREGMASSPLLWKGGMPLARGMAISFPPSHGHSYPLSAIPPFHRRKELVP